MLTSQTITTEAIINFPLNYQSWSNGWLWTAVLHLYHAASHSSDWRISWAKSLLYSVFPPHATLYTLSSNHFNKIRFFKGDRLKTPLSKMNFTGKRKSRTILKAIAGYLLLFASTNSAICCYCRSDVQFDWITASEACYKHEMFVLVSNGSTKCCCILKVNTDDTTDKTVSPVQLMRLSPSKHKHLTHRHQRNPSNLSNINLMLSSEHHQITSDTQQQFSHFTYCLQVGFSNDQSGILVAAGTVTMPSNKISSSPIRCRCEL